MTAPVETKGRLIAMTVPVEQGTAGTMRFYLPRKVAEAGAPEPTEAGVRLLRLPPERPAMQRFSGNAAAKAREQVRIFAEVLAKFGRMFPGPPSFMGYDPPFSVPFLRRNEVAVRLASRRRLIQNREADVGGVVAMLECGPEKVDIGAVQERGGAR